MLSRYGRVNNYQQEKTLRVPKRQGMGEGLK